MENARSNDEIMKIILHDYREDVLNRKNNRMKDNRREKLKVDKREWDKCHNILGKTLIYELSEVCGDVEDYSLVQTEAFSPYCKNYASEYKTADIMNGWWYCFKYIFQLESRTDKKNIEKLKDKIKEEENDESVIKTLMKSEYKYPKFDKEVYRALFRYLRVVYTIGNLTPVPINPRADYLDSWEYKLSKYIGLYHDHNGDKDILRFQDYYDSKGEIKNSYTKNGFENDPVEYLDSRTDLIIKRGYRILHENDIISEEFLQTIKDNCYCQVIVGTLIKGLQRFLCMAYWNLFSNISKNFQYRRKRCIC